MVEFPILAISFLKLVDFDIHGVPDPDALIAMEGARQEASTPPDTNTTDENESLLRSLGM